ncbi:zinc-ribbon domain-containing protein [Actinokineospora sp. NBRC 105648]|uniref:zinc ribbon domain-containing protein n=1 Tax=Actinokineospora sp. NBRC 105648 TaxID=3032206 RepID=UPI0025537506|nr:zinc-ribbon domain-containing protein [Actinokineospora sp. NBRC 105648]
MPTPGSSVGLADSAGSVSSTGPAGSLPPTGPATSVTAVTPGTDPSRPAADQSANRVLGWFSRRLAAWKSPATTEAHRQDDSPASDTRPADPVPGGASPPLPHPDWTGGSDSAVEAVQPKAPARRAAPAPDFPAPVQPAKPVAPRPARRAEVTEAATEGAPCPNCGTINPPGRRFCRNCATRLDESTPDTEGAGRSRRHRSGSGALTRRLILLGLLIIVVLAAVAFFPLGERLYQDILDKTSKTVPAVPATESATAEVPGHPATAAADGATNRYWGAPAVGASIEFTFPQPIRLLTIVTHTGPSAKLEDFQLEARATLVDVTTTSADGTTADLTLNLADEPGPQELDTAISDVTKIRLTIKAAAGLTPGKHIALGEVEFFRRS